MAGQQPFLLGAVAWIAQHASVMLAPSGFSPAHVILVVLATPVNHKLLKSLNSIFGRAPREPFAGGAYEPLSAVRPEFS
jgi:hypothetical protein